MRLPKVGERWVSKANARVYAYIRAVDDNSVYLLLVHYLMRGLPDIELKKFFLANYSPPRREIWVNVYQKNCDAYYSYEEADSSLDDTSGKTVKFVEAEDQD